jgi:leader peptidase (prepilin peptidase) / N-methyltransferase
VCNCRQIAVKLKNAATKGCDVECDKIGALPIQFSRQSLWMPTRRLRRFVALALDALRARGRAAEFTHVAWSTCGFAIGAALQAVAMGAFIVPTLVLATCLVLIMLYDGCYFIIPDQLIIVLAGAGLATAVWLKPDQLNVSCLAAGAAYGAARLLDLGYLRVRHQHGLGQGDAKLLGLMGLWLGFDGVASGLMWATLSALLSLLVARWRGTALTSTTRLPFGTHLALGFWATWVAGPLATI